MNDVPAPIPSLIWTGPFVALLLCIAILPLNRRTKRWWHSNRNKLLVGAALGLVTIGYYAFRGYGIASNTQMTAPGLSTVSTVLNHAMLDEYFPFISLLFALYVISGGVHLRGDFPAHPFINTTFLAIGAVLASFVGTTGASMLLIRPLLKTNSQRQRVSHTVIFFIFIVSNIGGSLLPIGDPPLFLGYLRGVPFLWTLGLWRPWAMCVGLLLVTYYFWDRREYALELPEWIRRDEAQVEPLALRGGVNLIWLSAVVVVTGMINPTKPFPGTSWTPPHHLRELLQLVVLALSFITTPRGLRVENGFSYEAIAEVACLFAGLFLCMQVPLEILDASTDGLGVRSPAKLFWATGLLSSTLDNAPTYLVFFEASLTRHAGPGVLQLGGGQFIREALLVAISLGAVFMGAATYLGNGPNFMVRSIAERAGVKMPSFFRYVLYSAFILLPMFIIVTLLFLR